MATAYWLARLAKVEELIEAYEAAILALAVHNTQSYTFDTSQTRQTVTKLSLPGLRKTLADFYADRDALDSRCNGTGGTHGGAAW